MDNILVNLLELDNLLFSHVTLIQRLPFLDSLIPWIDYLSQKGIVWLLILLSFGAFKGNSGKKIFFLGILSMALAWGLSELIKILIERPRPNDLTMVVELLANKPSNPSFPSVQTSVGFAAVSVLLTYGKDRLFKTCILILVLLVGYSRVYAGVCYPLDVIAGAILGKFCAKLVMGYLNTFNSRRKRRKRYTYAR